MFNSSTIRASLALAAAALLSGGCDLIDALSDEGDTLVTVFSNHHATPTDGFVPDRGGDGELRVFENDAGWTVHLTGGLITTQGVTLHRCDGTQSPIEFYFGSIAEDLRSADLERRTLGGTEVGAGELCGVTIHYGPFSAATDDAPDEMDEAQVDGLTIFLQGYAVRGEETIPFEIAVESATDVFTDLSERPSGPLKIKGDEDFPVELTVSKTYDRFFDGVEFDTLTDEDLSQNALAVLQLETSVEVNR